MRSSGAVSVYGQKHFDKKCPFSNQIRTVWGTGAGERGSERNRHYPKTVAPGSHVFCSVLLSSSISSLWLLSVLSCVI